MKMYITILDILNCDNDYDDDDQLAWPQAGASLLSLYRIESPAPGLRFSFFPSTNNKPRLVAFLYIRDKI